VKFFFEIFPIIIFFFVFKSHGIMAATAAAIVATIIQAGWSWVRNKKIEKMMMINLGIIVILGGATLALQDKDLHQMETNRTVLGLCNSASSCQI
jgi:intracellular septation protein